MFNKYLAPVHVIETGDSVLCEAGVTSDMIKEIQDDVETYGKTVCFFMLILFLKIECGARWIRKLFSEKKNLLNCCLREE